MIAVALALTFALADVTKAVESPNAPTADYREADSYLDYLLAGDVLTSGEFRLTFNALGLDRTCQLLRPAYEKAMTELTPAWRKLFKEMIAAGIESPGPLVANGEISRSQRQVLLGLGLKGNELVSSKSEAIKSALLDQALKVPDDSIDYQKRKMEMSDAVAKGTTDCELLQKLGEP